MYQVAAVIPNWNGAARLARLFEGLAAQTYPIHRVLVVDNGSTDNSALVAASAGAAVIQLAVNTGFSHAVNCGIRAAAAEWILILNNDVLPEPDWLEILMQTAAETKGQAWFVTGKLLDAARKDRLDGAFDAICRGACAWRCGHGRPDSPVWNQPREIRFAPLTAALFRAELFERVGLLDETMESYLEDIDLGIRCAALGLTGRYAPQAVAYHQGSATLGSWHPDTVRKISRNQLLIVAKHYPRKWILSYGWPILIAQALWGFTALRHWRFLAFAAGKLDAFRLFRKSRGEPCPNLAAILDRSEDEIRELQQLTGGDLYWKLYFALT
jgi:GT2 family glycosyltransferase